VGGAYEEDDTARRLVHAPARRDHYRDYWGDGLPATREALICRTLVMNAKIRAFCDFQRFYFVFEACHPLDGGPCIVAGTMWGL